ncbi:MAG: hypothetical protein HKN23_16450 [Verrucomicrobiales bacterium]|nr:hypothetical protein [Verrucomicrobiales bacterium]
MKFTAVIFAISIFACQAFAQEKTTAKGKPKAAPTTPVPAKTPRELIDGLNQANLQEAFRILRSEYINRDDFDYLELNRAAMQGLLNRLEFGASILTEESRSLRNSPYKFHSAKIDDSTAYLRFGKFNKSGVSELDKALKKFREELGDDWKTLIVDLRSPQAQADFAVAAEILGRFRPPNELLFKIRRPGDERPRLFVAKSQPASWSGDLILLVDTETGNVGEIIAGVLKKQNPDDVLIIGEKTRGLTVEYRDVPIGEDRILRYAIAEVVLDDDSSLFQKGIEPDVPAPASRKSKAEIFKLTETGKVPLTKFLFQKQRPRLNEAALVAGTDPELGYYLAKSNGRETEWDKPPLQDRALQQAVDLLTAQAFLSGKKAKSGAGSDEEIDKNAKGDPDED